MRFRRPVLEASDLDDASARAVIRHLKIDLRDDWYPDPVNWEDLLQPDFFRQVLLRKDRFFRLLCAYRPTNRVVRDVPKPNGTLRYSLEQTLVDRFVYQFVVSHLAPTLDRLLSARVLSHRACPTNKEGTLPKRLFKSGVEQWADFERLVGANVISKYVVEADIQTYYESITKNRVVHALESAIGEAPVSDLERSRLSRYVSILEFHLGSWTYAPSNGLPQNRDASSFLANMVMRTVDSDMINRGYDYFRYMDDMRIRCDSQADARRALSELCLSLRNIGLSLNSLKTKVHEPGSQWHNEQITPQDPRSRDIDNMWKSRSLHLIARSLAYLADLMADVIGKGRVDTREFRFCANRIARVLACPDITFDMPRAEELRMLILNAMEAHGHACADLCKLLSLLRPTPEELLRLENLLLDSNAFLHDWQRFQIARLLLQRHGRQLPNRIILHARKVLSGISDCVPMDMALLMLGSAEDPQDRRRIAREFRSLGANPHLQRSAFIAIHELDYDREIKQHVQGHVTPHLQGSLARYKRVCRQTYCHPLASIPLTELARSQDHYVG